MLTPGILILLLLLLLAVLGAALAIWLACRPDVRAGRLLQLANEATGRREYDDALRCYDGADRLRAKIKKQQTVDALGFAIEQGRGMCWLSKDRFAEAESHLLRAAEFLDQGVEHERSIVVFLYSDIASALFGQGKDTEGEAALDKVDELCAATIDHQTCDVAELLVGAASGAAAKNQFDSAFRLARKAVQMLSKTDFWHAGHLADAQIGLASIHALVGEYRLARELVENAIASTGEGQLDESDRDNAMFYLGQLCLIASDFPTAIDCLEQSLEYRAQEHGRDHWETGITRAALAAVYRAYGDYEQSEAYFRDAYASQAEQLGEDDAILIGTELQFALLLTDLGKHDEADVLLRSVESVPLAVAQGNALPALRLIRGIWHLDRFQFDLAVASLKESLALAQAIYGESSILTADYRGILGMAQMRAGSLDEAERTMIATLRLRESAPDASALDLADLLIGMAELFVATKRSREAEASARRAMVLITGRVLPTNLTLARLHTTLAESLACRGAHDEANRHILQAEKILQQVQPATHPRLVRFYTAAAEVYSAAGDALTADRFGNLADQIQSPPDGIDS